MRGTVKEVLSGDTLVLAGTVRVGIPPEKKLTLASLMAPRLVCTSCIVLYLSLELTIFPFRVRGVVVAILDRPLQFPHTPPFAQGRRDGSTADEPFAWQSREFLRKLTIGKVRRM